MATIHEQSFVNAHGAEPNYNDTEELQSDEPQSFTVGKIDAGVAVLLGPSFHLIEFPSVLLPASCKAGSIVSISCQRALDQERDAELSFVSLQESILKTYGSTPPSPPQLNVLSATQTSATLSWSPLEIANAKLLSLAVYRNNQRLSLVTNPFQNTTTKVSSLEVNTSYSFHLVMKTSAGTYQSNQVQVKTLKLEDTTGISVCFGHIYPNELRDEAEDALRRMGAKWSESDTIDIETTHFVCTSAGSGNHSQQYQRADRLNIPTVPPTWILACDKEKRMVNVAKYYLKGGSTDNNATIARQPPANVQEQSQQQQQTQPQAQTQVQEQEAPVPPPAPEQQQPTTGENQDASKPANDETTESSEPKSEDKNDEQVNAKTSDEPASKNDVQESSSDKPVPEIPSKDGQHDDNDNDSNDINNNNQGENENNINGEQNDSPNGQHEEKESTEQDQKKSTDSPPVPTITVNQGDENEESDSKQNEEDFTDVKL